MFHKAGEDWDLILRTSGAGVLGCLRQRIGRVLFQQLVAPCMSHRKGRAVRVRVCGSNIHVGYLKGVLQQAVAAPEVIESILR